MIKHDPDEIKSPPCLKKIFSRNFQKPLDKHAEWCYNGGTRNTESVREQQKGIKKMTLFDLKNVLDFTFDLEDTEVCGEFYIELDEINEEYARQIEVVKIGRDVVTCKLTDFLRRMAKFHPTKIVEYLNDNYYDGDQKDYLLKQLTKRLKEDIADDGGEAVYHFITNDMYDFLTQ
jgi:hypothetical protein